MNISALDPISDFCSVWNHAAVVFRNKLYIAQGNAAYKTGSAASTDDVVVEEGNNPWLRYISLDDSFSVVDIGSHISVVPSDEYSLTLPQRKNPILWDIVTTEFSSNGNSGIIAYTLGLPVGNITSAGRGGSLYFSIASNKTSGAEFGSFGTPNGAFSIDTPYTDNERFFASRNNYFDSENGIGYVVGGMVGDTPTGTFLTFEGQGSPQWRNSSLPWGVTAGDGAMGSFKINNRTVHVYTGGEVNGVNSNFDIARIFDSRSNAWYDQPLTGYQGRIPSPRRGSCTAVVAAPDGSSYQMLMFGGASDDENETPFGELWALNIPSFTWVLLDNSAGGSGALHVPGGRFGSTCHLIQGNKFMVLGGSKVRVVERLTGPLNCDLNQNLGFIMDLNNGTWLENYDGTRTNYTVPERVQVVIGGGATGGATMGQPVDGFADPTLSEILRVPTSTSTVPPTSTGTSTDSPDPTPGSGGGGGLATGAIVGIAIAAVLAGLGGLFFLYRWTRNRKRQRLEGDDPDSTNGKSELPGLSNNLGYDEQRKIYKDNAGNVIARQELGGGIVNPSELPAGHTDDPSELPAGYTNVMELPAKNAMHPVELPADVPHSELPDRNSQLPAPPVPPKAPGA
ncbi:hypothetical protein TWF481_004468 [Arthrobotrys musiformis]|uniref:Kelch repeat protein n=1 Tax=Arthrobotrys musiformis TaxID=47236 RepID=A0AAV9WJQ3_9PEZI